MKTQPDVYIPNTECTSYGMQIVRKPYVHVNVRCNGFDVSDSFFIGLASAVVCFILVSNGFGG